MDHIEQYLKDIISVKNIIFIPANYIISGI